MDQLTQVGAGLAILGSKDLLLKLLGPTAEYIGGELRNAVERCNVNLGKIFQIALRKLGSRAEHPGIVSPRVLKRIIEDGRFCEDPVMAEYLAGVLASSKGDSSRDDRGAYYLNEINSLSTYQLRTHYLLYSTIIRHSTVFRSKHHVDQDFSYWYEHDSISVVIPESGYLLGMEYSEDERTDEISRHSFLGLETRRLCKGGTEVLGLHKNSDFNVPFRFYWPTRYGFDLFLWGLGLGKLRVRSYFDLDFDIELPLDPPFSPLHVQLGQRNFM